MYVNVTKICPQNDPARTLSVYVNAAIEIQNPTTENTNCAIVPPSAVRRQLSYTVNEAQYCKPFYY